MPPELILQHFASGELWPVPSGANPSLTVPEAYDQALEVRRLRLARGEVPRGYKIGFTNRNIWSLYSVFAPIWGTIYDTTLNFCDGLHELSIERLCQPRIEPETVFCFSRTPKPNATPKDIFDALDWVGPGFEIVQSHLADWKFTAAQTVQDGGLHGRLVVGKTCAVRHIAGSVTELERILATATVILGRDGIPVESGKGANVLDNPVKALHHFLHELRHCLGATDIKAGDVVTTGTWTNAWPIKSGDSWTADFSSPLASISAKIA